jgi:hypothetical protein
MSRGCAVWVVLFIAGLVSVIPFTLVPTPDAAWTQAYVEANWGYVESGVIYPDVISNRAFDVGWDSTRRYYANRDAQDHGINIIDRFSHQTCSIQWGTIWADGHWLDNTEGTTGYAVQINNQYGLDVSFQLDLLTWQITETTYGYCPMSPNDCHPVDPPLVSTYTCTA